LYDGDLSGPEFPAALRPLSKYGRPELNGLHSGSDTSKDSSDSEQFELKQRFSRRHFSTFKEEKSQLSSRE